MNSGSNGRSIHETALLHILDRSNTHALAWRRQRPGLHHPPVVLLSEQDAVRGMTGGATKFFVREVRLTAEERGTIRQQWNWQAEDELYRFYLGRDAAGQLVAAVIFLTGFTIHGPVRVAVGLHPDGTVKDAKVVELTEETLPWLQGATQSKPCARLCWAG